MTTGAVDAAWRRSKSASACGIRNLPLVLEPITPSPITGGRGPAPDQESRPGLAGARAKDAGLPHGRERFARIESGSGEGAGPWRIEPLAGTIHALALPGFQEARREPHEESAPPRGGRRDPG